ncbi:MAG: ABC transporter permease [Candidatus Eremiobacteraeota bacterium]|nr:ABC transporter permease [Candidatus Eremiobacteraeota bacterium]
MDLHTTLLVAILAAAVRAGTPILLATLGEIIAERAGMLNLGLEGMMLVGALSGFATYQRAAAICGIPVACEPSGKLLIVALLAAMAAAALLALVHGLVTITCRANQVVSGLAVTIFGAGITGFAGDAFVGLPAKGFPVVPVPLLSKIPVLGPAFFQHNVLVYFSYLLVPLVWFFLFRTRWGLELRSAGESPRTADVMGINVTAVRFAALLVGGLFAGLAGASISLAYTPGWTEMMTGGRGWIAVAIVIFSGWNPLRAAAGAYLFGGISGIQMRIQAAGTHIPANVLMMFPYLFTILVLVIASSGPLKRFSQAPKGLGLPYIREERE